MQLLVQHRQIKQLKVTNLISILFLLLILISLSLFYDSYKSFLKLFLPLFNTSNCQVVIHLIIFIFILDMISTFVYLCCSSQWQW